MNRKTGAQILACAAALLAGTLALRAAAPLGWQLAGNKPTSYDTGTDSRVLHNNQRSAYLKSTEIVLQGFGTLMQDFTADKYAGQRVRFGAFVKSQSVDDWAGLWMRVDKGSQMAIAFDNMEHRAIRGTTDWRHYEVVLDVPHDANRISIGILLSKTGTVWMSGATFETVDSSVPTTGPSLHDEPINLGFEQD